MKKLLPLLSILLLLSCKKEEQKEAILLANREAPMGWVCLRIYADSTFEFESRGLERKGTIFAGHAEINKDSIFFHYKDSIPYTGDKAIYDKYRVAYTNGKIRESLEITLSKLDK